MKKNVKEIIMDILILIIVILLYVFVFMWIYTNFRERKRKEMSKGIIDVIDKEIKEKKQDLKENEETIQKEELESIYEIDFHIENINNRNICVYFYCKFNIKLCNTLYRRRKIS